MRDSVYECYREAGAPDNILIRKLPTGHKFIDEFKWEAYARLKEHFGMVPDPDNTLSMISAMAVSRRYV